MDPNDVRKPEDLDGLDKDGLIAFLGSDREDKVELWNAWRKANDWKPVDLTGATLFGAHLKEANLGGANLTGASLDGANLTGASLRWANLIGASLDRANLIGASLRWANLIGASLGGANLAGADLRLVRLRDVALSAVAEGGLHGVHLYQTYFWGVLSLRYQQFLGDNQKAKGLHRLWLGLWNLLEESTIWEETEGRFSEAKDVFKTLKGYFEDAGDYEGANWAYIREQVMEKLMRAPPWLRWLYPRWRGKFDDDYCQPSLVEWLRLEFSEKIANYGDSLLRPVFWLLVVIVGFALVYQFFGLTCRYEDWVNQPVGTCQPTTNFVDNLLFSLAAMTTADVRRVQLYRANVGFLMTLETLIGIAVTGLLGFVLGNKLRYS